ncbi:MAG: phosphoglycerate dehydrogenase [Deltaproteobacteria bacterium]|nr:phosphoglycerate dehydrogenase [Deltaproteobacteria bacterium]
MRVLISDPLSEVGVRRLEEAPDIEVEVNTGLGPEELKEVIGDFDGLVIRSATKVTSEIIEAAEKLKVIGRAGIGVDNVDIPAATRKGIVVMNTPHGNTITTAEHAIALMMALSRNIPQATASMKEGKWEKKKLQGRELYDKTLGLIGAGNIGRIVADRARGLKMKVIVYDPYINPETVKDLELEPVSFEDLLHRSDYITIHTPKTEETANMINRDTMAKMKKGAMVINCARGGIVNEDDLYEALASGHLGGAALDVFSTEPPGRIKLLDLPNFICTPHLGASTREAQENVARDVAEQIVAFLREGTVKNAVNVPSISGELMRVLNPFMVLAEKMGLLQGQLAEGGLKEVQVRYAGRVAEYDVAPLTAAVLKGLLTPALDGRVNFVSAPHIASERGIKVIESRTETSEDFASLIFLKVVSANGENIVSGTVFGKKLPRIVRINDFYLEAVPEGHNLLLFCEDVPGVIGRIGTLLGENSLNIGRMQVGREEGDGRTVIFLNMQTPVGEVVLKGLGSLENVLSVKRVEL